MHLFLWVKIIFMSRGVRKEGLIRKRLLWLLGAGIVERERMGIEVFFYADPKCEYITARQLAL